MQTSLFTTAERQRLTDRAAEQLLQSIALRRHARQLNAMDTALIESVSIVGQLAIESFEEQVLAGFYANREITRLASQLIPQLHAWKG